MHRALKAAALALLFVSTLAVTPFGPALVPGGNPAMATNICNDDNQNGGSNVPALLVDQYCSIVFSQTAGTTGGIGPGRFKAFLDAVATNNPYPRPLIGQYGNIRQFSDNVDCGGVFDATSGDPIWQLVTATPNPIATTVPENQIATHALTTPAPVLTAATRLAKDSGTCNPAIPKYFPNSLNPAVRNAQLQQFRQQYNSLAVQQLIDTADFWHIDSSKAWAACNSGTSNATNFYEAGAQTDATTGNPDTLSTYQAMNLAMVRGSDGRPMPLELNVMQCNQATLNVTAGLTSYAIGVYGDPWLFDISGELLLQGNAFDNLTMAQTAFVGNDLSILDNAGIRHRFDFKIGPCQAFTSATPCTPIGEVYINGTTGVGDSVTAIIDGTSVTYNEGAGDTTPGAVALGLANAINANGTVNVFAVAANSTTLQGCTTNLACVFIRASDNNVHTVTATCVTTSCDELNFYNDALYYMAMNLFSDPTLDIIDANLAADDTNTTAAWAFEGIRATQPTITWGAYTVPAQTGQPHRGGGCGAGENLSTDHGYLDLLITTPSTCHTGYHIGFNVGMHAKPYGDVKVWGVDRGKFIVMTNDTNTALTVPCSININNGGANTPVDMTVYTQKIQWSGGSLAPGTGTYYPSGTPSNLTFTPTTCNTGTMVLNPRSAILAVQHL